MGNGFRIDEEKALDYMTRADLLATGAGAHVVYALVCHHGLEDGVGSHGGAIMTNAREAIDKAQAANDAVPDDHACRYVPVALTLTPMTAARMYQDAEATPPEDRDQP